jgi:Integrase core domain
MLRGAEGVQSHICHHCRSRVPSWSNVTTDLEGTGPLQAHRVAGPLDLRRVRDLVPPLAERLAGTLRRECLDHVLILGERHLLQDLAGCARHYNQHRPHQGRQREPALRRGGRVVDITARIERRQVPGGLISQYR